jgi:hypothetical protein
MPLVLANAKKVKGFPAAGSNVRYRAAGNAVRVEIIPALASEPWFLTVHSYKPNFAWYTPEAISTADVLVILAEIGNPRLKWTATPSSLRPKCPSSKAADRMPEFVTYFIQAGDTGPIKIGHASHIERRLSSLQASNHERLYLRGVLPSAQYPEFRVQNMFAKYRLHGEWFSPSPKILAFIASDEVIKDVPLLPIPSAIAHLVAHR